MSRLPPASFWHALAQGPKGLDDAALRQGAAELGISLLEAQQQCCLADLMPTRYARNARSLSPADQLLLLRGKVLLVGLGGLGGHVLDMLARMGVGSIVGVDGDRFEQSNANRQLLATQQSMGCLKATAAAAHVLAVNPAVHFEPVPHFVQGQGFAPWVDAADVVVDALGGLKQRAALHRAAAEAQKPVVCAGIAGCTGWVAVVRPDERSPVEFLDRKVEENRPQAGAQTSAEEALGNLAPTVNLAASLQSAEILKLLIQRQTLRGMLVFDLWDQTFINVSI